MNTAIGCPYHKVSESFKPFDLTNPFPFYKQAREEEPIFFSEELGYYVVTRFQDIKEIFGNWKVFTSENAQSPFKPIAPKAKALMEEGGLIGLSGLSGRIPPDHTRIRRIVSMAFNVGRFRKLEPKIRELAINMIEDFAAKGKTNIIKDLAYDLPAYVIFMLLGVPNEEVQQVKSWAESRLLLTWGDLSEDDQLMHAQNMVKYWNYCQGLVAKRKENPTDDLPGDLVRYQAEGYEISDREIAAMCYSALFAGHETTTSLLGNGIRELLIHRKSWESLCTNHEMIPNAVEEVLRYSPSIVSWRRRSTEEATVGGITIPAGSNILLVMGSGNRDEAQFENGEDFDIERKNANQHLSMGSGIHFCLGAPLAKLEAKVVLEELTKRLPSLRLTPEQTFAFAQNTSFRAPVALEVEWDV
ncbi:cytochrome P450 [Emticicia oligotrophica DSM 17448]|uniref:Cytochrome P450 n=1 Tax=Emticicia oligotrophica (strain DSM 17448 / CIP 109782 / MTCC 6937 / GPTSA100-15) TaxID=929562 RepID=A0ABM5N4G7_EMTOG|nr:cytochrome P450 [Emticicia oligotrophica]AFK04374.1 cytochrome P450 [Emticicia oligotrophica DSM 17448]